jgi:enterochelin esterase-like enzyme
MNLSSFVSKDRLLSRPSLSTMQFFLAVGATCLSAALLFSERILESLVTMIIGIGLDPLRAQLIAALLLTGGAALVGAACGRHKGGAMLGGGIAFCLGYLANFLQLEQGPVYDPAGNLEVLNEGALIHTAAVMLALGLLSGFLGAAVGVALGEVLLDPPYRLLALTWHRIAHPDDGRTPRRPRATEQHTAQTPSTPMLLWSWVAAVLMLLLLVLASSSVDLFVFAPDIGLHGLPPLAPNGRIPAHGTIVEDSLLSPALGGQRRSFLVYLPPSYFTPQGRTKRYPTLYLLHGSPGSEYDWLTGGKADQSADALIASGKIPELILILPDGNGRPGETSEWGNSFDGRQLMETFVAVELVRYVDQHYRTLADPAYRGIGGLSMGGFGAMNIAVHHPDIFGFVISLGGYYHAEGSVWGNNAACIRANSPADVLPGEKRAWNLRMYIGAATKDQPYYTAARQFVQELAQLHVAYHFDVQHGYHAWNVWQTQLYHALLWLHWG